MRQILAVMLLTACAGSPSAPAPSTIRLPANGKADGLGTLAPYHCPQDWRFGPSGDDTMYCVFDSLSVPPDAQPDCDLSSHQLGFTFQSGESVDCPSSATAADGSCSFTVNDAPPEAIPYCDYLQYGYIGYLWDLCPPGSTVGNHSCSYTALNLPAGAREYCEYLSLGYFGYYWQLAPDEKPSCPSGFVYGDNGEGYGFCVVENLRVPAELTLQPACDDLASGQLGFTW